MIEQLEVPYLPFLDRFSPLTEVSEKLDQLERHALEQAPWSAFAYKPNVAFAMAHCNDCLLVKFYVEESAIRAVFRRTNDPVYRDSCVEVFIAFNGEAAYYNLEFNSLGTCLMGFGAGKTERVLLSEAVISKVKRWAQLSVGGGKDAGLAVKWELTVMVPVEAFWFHDLEGLNGENCKVNFFKCGDDLSTPHYLSWTAISASEPEFHLPEYFGELQFL